MEQKAFWPEFMEKDKPRVPRKICSSWIHWILGIASPSLECIYLYSGDEEVCEYNRLLWKWMCYKRQMPKEMWQIMWREYRKEKNGYNIRKQNAFSKAMDLLDKAVEEFAESIKEAADSMPGLFSATKDKSEDECQMSEH